MYGPSPLPIPPTPDGVTTRGMEAPVLIAESNVAFGSVMKIRRVDSLGRALPVRWRQPLGYENEDAIYVIEAGWGDDAVEVYVVRGRYGRGPGLP